MQKYRVIGLMSGTSLDGIDAALIVTDGENEISREAFVTFPYEDNLRLQLRKSLNTPMERIGELRNLEIEVTKAHAEVVEKLLKEKNLTAKDIDLIGFHGQTVAHVPEKGFTCQLGDGALLAQLTGIRTVNDFRTADVKAGGQGAPLAPVYHRALAAQQNKPVVFVNIGGVANVTFIGTDGEILAFDTGPGNALMDDWVLKMTGHKYDADGKLASLGTVDERILDILMSHPFFKAKPPKSLDRNDFVSDIWHEMPKEDAAATLNAFTVESIAKSLDFFPEKPTKWIVSGGGRLNKFLMRKLQEKVGAEVVAIEALGFNGDAIEAEAFAYMAVRSLRGLPISFPKTTGVAEPMTGGKLNALSEAA